MALRKKVCAVADVPATGFRVFRVDGLDQPVLVARVGGDLVASPGICPHEDVELEGGELVGRRIICPGHAYEFDLVTGQCVHDRTLCLKPFRVIVMNETLYIDVVT